jgi:flagellar hook capping protein FlgD
VARVLPIVVVLALLGCTAAAFAVTEGLKLEHSPITNTHVGKVVAPDSLANKTVPIAFLLRKRDRVTVELVNGSGDIVRTLVRSRKEPSGNLQFTWNGRDDNGEVLPDGTYRPRVHLANAHKTIVLPNPIRMDATPPFIRLVSVTPRVFSPDGDFTRDQVRIRYQTSERARAQLYVDGEPRTLVHDFLRAGKIDWPRGSLRLKPGRHLIRLRGLDLATNLGPPSRALPVFVRYIELRPHALRVKTGRRFGFRVLTDAKRYSVHLGSQHARRGGRLLILRAPAPGRYVLRVAEHGHVAKAIVTVTP